MDTVHGYLKRGVQFSHSMFLGWAALLGLTELGRRANTSCTARTAS